MPICSVDDQPEIGGDTPAHGAHSDNRSFHFLSSWGGGLRTDQLLEIETVASDWPASHLERSENRGRFLPLKDCMAFVVPRENAANSLAVRGAMARVAMKKPYVTP